VIIILMYDHHNFLLGFRKDFGYQDSLFGG